MSTPIRDIILEIKRHPTITSEQTYNDWYVRLCDIMRKHGDDRAQAVRNGYEMDSNFCNSINEDNEKEIARLQAEVADLRRQLEVYNQPRKPFSMYSDNEVDH